MKNTDECRLITPEFRVSYPHIFKPHAPKPGDKPKFSITMLFPKDTDLMGSSPDGKPRSLKRIIKNAKVAEFGPDKAKWPKDLESPVHDGDDEKYADKDGYQGHWIVKASTSEEQRPAVVDRKMSIITESADVYPGCYARAAIKAFVWFYPNREKPMKKGIGLVLDHVQKLRDGKAFGGKKPVEQVFAPLEDADSDDDSDDEDDE